MIGGSRKAILAGLIAGVGSLAVAAADNGITLAEWLIAASATLTAAGGVWGVRNDPVTEPSPQG